MMEDIAFLHKEAKSDFGVSFPDFPGCITAGKTLDEAGHMASEALALPIRGGVPLILLNHWCAVLDNFDLRGPESRYENCVPMMVIERLGAST